MKPAPISFLHYFVSEVSVIAKFDFDPESPVQGRMDEFQTRLDLRKTQQDEDEKDLWQVDLEVNHQPSPEVNFPYEFKMKIHGFFECVVEELEVDEQERQVRINGASMLYGIVREVIRANTSRGPWNSIMIPTISFYEPKA